MITALVIIVGGTAFYGGMRYSESRQSALRRTGAFQNLQNLSPEERQQAMQQFRNGSGSLAGRRNGAGGPPGGGLVSGEILAKDDKSITVKLRDGGSKIIFFSSSTSINKTTDGAPSDLEVGKQTMVTGKANDDGSITAESIQIRPNLPAQN